MGCGANSCPWAEPPSQGGQQEFWKHVFGASQLEPHDGAAGGPHGQGGAGSGNGIWIGIGIGGGGGATNDVGWQHDP